MATLKSLRVYESVNLLQPIPQHLRSMLSAMRLRLADNHHAPCRYCPGRLGTSSLMERKRTTPPLVGSSLIPMERRNLSLAPCSQNPLRACGPSIMFFIVSFSRSYSPFLLGSPP